MSTGALPPFVIVGVDHPGPARPFEYTPYKPGKGPGERLLAWLRAMHTHACLRGLEGPGLEQGGGAVPLKH
jgi:hypothetical protein